MEVLSDTQQQREIVIKFTGWELNSIVDTLGEFSYSGRKEQELFEKLHAALNGK